MTNTKSSWWNVALLTCFAVGLLMSSLAGMHIWGASLASISGTVNDDSGKPLRGARVTVTSGYKSVSRFADAAGRYKITGLAPGNYTVSATAWGFEDKKNQPDISGNSE